MVGVIARTQGFLTFLGEVADTQLRLARALRRPWYVGEWVRVTAWIGAKCVPPVFLVLAAFGAVVAIQGTNILNLFNMEKLLGNLLLASFQKELGPILAGVVVAVQAGSTISAEIGTMKIREQIDALEVMAVDPARFLYLPRFIAPIIIMPLLSLLGGALAVVAGSWLAVRYYHVDRGELTGGMFQWLTMGDLLWSGLVKSTSFGLFIGLFAVHHGARAEGGAPGVGRASNRTIVHAILTIFFLNSLWSNLLYR